MPTIDWTSPGFLLALVSIGAVLIVLGILFYFLRSPRLKGLALAAGILGGLSAGTALGLRLVPRAEQADAGKSAEPPPEPQPQPISALPPAQTASESLERFRKATPAERMAFLARLPDSAAAWYTVQRGDVDSLVERGTLESAENAEIAVKVHAPQLGSSAATIKSVAEDGATVKKGQLLVELDDSDLRERLKAQKLVVERAKSDLAEAHKQAELDTERDQLDLEKARHQLALAERDSKAYTGNDAQHKKRLELQVKNAQQTVKSRDFQRTKWKARNEAVLRAAQDVLDGETNKSKDLEKEIANCKMYAPRDGQVFYYVPSRRWGGGRRPVVAPEEPVDEGQILLIMPDLSKMLADVGIAQSHISLVRAEQPAHVRVDAFPNRAFPGKVARIGPVSERQASAGVYPVAVVLTGDKLGLKPGMNAEVRIQVEPHRNVPRVPAQALVNDGERIVCFVKAGAEIEERPVVAGLNADGFVEITDGLKEGDQVLHDPQAVVNRLAEKPVSRPTP